ncbi:MAG: hypothetical protein JXR46_01445 [Calditrichaceae bacterium]|nr:hypothetical protein [Calditrichaceae bacterium]MBN2707682.1 hypothetical protein [Calditrichaceae bacterium]RQV97786.1 MAG: hypothetical protein EH224_00190 [Calditrichota bacterium]
MVRIWSACPFWGYYFGARYYDAEIGRWPTVDPMADKYPSLSPYVYCANSPLIYKDPDGRFLDTFLDVGFILYDVYDIASTAISGEGVSGTQWAALGADAVGALVPFATGGGMVVRAAAHADDIVDGIKAVDKAVDASKAVDKGTDAQKTYQTYTKTNATTG